MLSRLKRFGMAFVFLFLVVLLMLLGTLGVKDFGDKMFEDANITMHPEGEHIKL
jgi:Na+-transporting methylmalonyl-CoA/oxaloacetate decarboxylase gamma subunit